MVGFEDEDQRCSSQVHQADLEFRSFGAWFAIEDEGQRCSSRVHQVDPGFLSLGEEWMNEGVGVDGSQV